MENLPIPSEMVLKNAAKLSIKDDKPIMLDYWSDSCEETPEIMIGVKTTDEKLLVRSEEEFTSPISKIFKVNEEYIIVTENSIYIVSCKIPTRRIS
tara:strand:- start:1144 stop:1431 length:288 start_codon:yes stop_codon:yes gene_type:complete